MSYTPNYQSGQAPRAAAASGSANNHLPHLVYNFQAFAQSGQTPVQLQPNSQNTSQRTQTRPRRRVPLPSNGQLTPNLIPTSNGYITHIPQARTSQQFNANPASVPNHRQQKMSESIIKGADVIMELIDSERNSATKVLSDMFEHEKKLRLEEKAKREALEVEYEKLKSDRANLFENFYHADMQLRKLVKEREKRKDNVVNGGVVENEGSSSMINIDNAAANSTMISFPTSHTTAMTQAQQVQSTTSSYSQFPATPHSAELNQYKASLARLLEEYQSFRVEAYSVVIKARETIKKLAWEVKVCRARGRCGEVENISAEKTYPYPTDESIESYFKSSPNMRTNQITGPGQLQKQLKLLNDEINSAPIFGFASSSTNLNATGVQSLGMELEPKRKRKREMFNERDNEQLMSLQRQQQMVLENANANMNANMNVIKFHPSNSLSNAVVDADVAEAIGFSPAMSVPGMNMNINIGISNVTNGGETSMSTSIIPPVNMAFGETPTMVAVSVRVGNESQHQVSNSDQAVIGNGSENLPSDSVQAVVTEVVGGEAERSNLNVVELAVSSDEPRVEEIDVFDVDEWVERESEKEKRSSLEAKERPSGMEEGETATAIKSSLFSEGKSKSKPSTPTLTTALADSLPSSSVHSQLQSNTDRGVTGLPSMSSAVVSRESSSRQLVDAERKAGPQTQAQPPIQTNKPNTTTAATAHPPSSFGTKQPTPSATINTNMAYPEKNQNNTNASIMEPSNVPDRPSNNALPSSPSLDRASTSTNTAATPTTPVTPVSPASTRIERAKAMEAARASLKNVRSGISLRTRGDF